MSGRPDMMVKQYVATVHGDWASFRVFATGTAGIYLFDQLDPAGCSTTIQFPVRAADLRPDLRRALRHGWGLTTAKGAARLAAATTVIPAGPGRAASSPKERLDPGRHPRTSEPTGP